MKINVGKKTMIIILVYSSEFIDKSFRQLFCIVLYVLWRWRSWRLAQVSSVSSYVRSARRSCWQVTLKTSFYLFCNANFAAFSTRHLTIKMLSVQWGEIPICTIGFLLFNMLQISTLSPLCCEPSHAAYTAAHSATAIYLTPASVPHCSVCLCCHMLLSCLCSRLVISCFRHVSWISSPVFILDTCFYWNPCVCVVLVAKSRFFVENFHYITKPLIQCSLTLCHVSEFVPSLACHTCYYPCLDHSHFRTHFHLCPVGSVCLD